jgi:hypothetical protein
MSTFRVEETMRTAIVGILLAALAATPSFADGLAVGETGGDFVLAGPRGGKVSFEGLLRPRGTNALVVRIASYTCPYSLRADQELKARLASDATRGVQFVALFPNAEEDAAGLKAYAEKVALGHLLLLDPDGRVAKRYGAEVTPTFYVFDREARLRYRGALEGLSAALDACLSGGEVAETTVAPKGCAIRWSEGDAREEATPDVLTDGSSELSPGALEWLDRLISSLSSEDELVHKSALSGLAAYGPAALPALRRARESAEGAVGERLDQVIRQVRSGRVLAAGAREGRRAERDRPRTRSFLDFQKRIIDRVLTLTPEQDAAVVKAFDDLRPMEADLRRVMDEGSDREKAVELRTKYMQAVDGALEKVFTPQQFERLMQARQNMRRPGGGGR